MENNSIKIKGTCYWGQDVRTIEITFWPDSNKFHMALLSSLDKFLGSVVVDAGEVKKALENCKSQEVGVDLFKKSVNRDL